MTADTLLAQSAIDRLTATATASSKDRPTGNAPDPASLTQTRPTSILNNAPRWSHPPGNHVVPSPWQSGGPITLASDRLANSSAIAWPIPLEAPVITTRKASPWFQSDIGAPYHQLQPNCGHTTPQRTA